MIILTLKSNTQLIGGKQAESYGIYCGGELLRNVSPFEYDEARRIVNRANEVLEKQIWELIKK